MASEESRKRTPAPRTRERLLSPAALAWLFVTLPQLESLLESYI